MVEAVEMLRFEKEGGGRPLGRKNHRMGCCEGLGVEWSVLERMDGMFWSQGRGPCLEDTLLFVVAASGTQALTRKLFSLRGQLTWDGMVISLPTGCPSGWLKASVFGAPIFLPGGMLSEVRLPQRTIAFSLGTIGSPFP